jgi:CRP/FNR family transcriptional regulator
MTKAPYGIDVQESCQTCSVREERIFCNLSPEALRFFDQIKYTAVYPRGAVLFVEGQQPMGIYVVCSGKVKLYTTSADGKTLITQIADPGEVLGVNAVVSGRPFEVTAETLEPCHVKFARRDDFLSFLRTYGEVSLRILQLLSNSCQCSHEQARSFGLSQSATERLARFILDRCEREGERVDRGVRVRLALTHEEIGQTIGTSRETVTRVLGQLKRKHLIHVKGSTLLVKDLPALQALVH